MSAEIPLYLKRFMEQRSDLLVSQNTEPSEGDTTTLFDTTYGLRVTKTEQDGGIWFNFSLVPSPASINSHPEGKDDFYDINPMWDTPYLTEGSGNPWGMSSAEINRRFPNIADDFDDWRLSRENAMGMQMWDPDPEVVDRAVEDDVGEMVWKIEGFLMACWMALQPDVLGVGYKTVSEIYLLRKDDNDMDLEFQELINSEIEPWEALSAWVEY
ncbi:uncharacterized protein F4807DRAFT_468266 [Annulohypoxylon truncatum]|uniref:uncharacterized protein n=1 Tax=Annulohypoxylon truncatum TaxID=327061 RepID=UPI002008BC14|nr:uncharacterized protein F4807DRAFT_468266 [Annulohypoxylon truncatum]KAI1214346.1 hypothetical protein F4807DRAFT_468266 [Annulohypoxylon truncatum]